MNRTGTGSTAPSSDAGGVVISVDAMGGDSGPATVVAGLAKFLGKTPGARVILHGSAEVLTPLVAFLPLAGWLFAVVSVVLSAEFLRRAWILRQSTDNKGAGGLFGFSILWLFALFLTILIEHWTGIHG